MSQLRLAPQVRRDLMEIDEYISRDNPVAAARLISGLKEKCVLLSEQPGIGRDRSDLLRNLRSFPFGNYVIFCFPEREGVEVIRILHGARDIEQLFDTD